MARKKKHEEHTNHEAWAIPYGDLVTLLFALFTVMYAMSSVNEGKYRILSDSLVAAFRGAPTSPKPVKVGESAKGQGGDAQLSGVTPTALLKLADPRPMPESGDPAKRGHDGDDEAARKAREAARTDPKAALFYMADEVRKALQSLIDQRMVRVRQNALTLEVEIKTDILFASGVATVDARALPVLEKVADILKPFPNALRVEGHTDDRPISTALFPSNWELSAARAANVVQLFSRSGIDPRRMEVLGLGENRPIADNATVEGRNANRRVVIVVVQEPESGPAVAGGPAEGAGPAVAARPGAGPAATPEGAPASTPPTPVAAVAPAPGGGPAPTGSVASLTTRTTTPDALRTVLARTGAAPNGQEPGP
jgi:chemotaxis protein MotB